MFLPRTLLATLALGLGVAAPAHAVVGGNDASPGEYPYVAHVLIDRAFQCTGTLVTPTHVVTAAHCSSVVPGGIANVPLGQPGQLVEVSIGAHRTPDVTLLGGYESDGEEHVAKTVTVNPGYAGLGSVSHDVAVVELPSPSSKTPVKVASAAERSLWTAGTLATIAGFGDTEEGGDPPDVLQEARVPIVADEVAAEAYPYLIEGVDPLFGGFENETQVAAGYPEGGVDTCQGDSGGPLLVSAGTEMRLVGDTSYGVGCAREGFPGVYGRLADTTLREWLAVVAPGSISTGSTSGGTTGGGGSGGKGSKGGGGGKGKQSSSDERGYR
jgi:trypsin